MRDSTKREESWTGTVNYNYRLKRSAAQSKRWEFLQEIIGLKYHETFMISAVLGYNNNVFEKIEKTQGDGGMLMQNFNHPGLFELMDLIVYARTGNQRLLYSLEKYEILESYANAGFEILWKNLGLRLETIPSSRVKQEVSRKLYALLKDDFQPITDLLLINATEEMFL